MGNAAARTAFAALLIATLAGCGSLAEIPSGPIDEDPTSSLEWSSTDIGAVHAAGNVETADDGILSVQSGGEDVWSTADAFHFVYTELTGDLVLEVHVELIDGPDDWAKAGLMIRESLAPEARNVFLPLTAARGAVMQVRADDGAATFDTLPSGITMHDASPSAPWWLRLTRDGTTVTGFVSPDGERWSELGRIDMPLPETVYAGVAVSSHASDRVATARFTSLRGIGSRNPPAGEPEPAPQPDPQPEPDPAPDLPPPPGGRVTVTYASDATAFPNPERGWYVERASGDYDLMAADGYRLVMRYVNLGDYRYQATLPSSVLAGLQTDFDRARDAGVKLIVRFAYNRSFGEDAPIDVVLAHIDQVGDVLRANADVLATWQAGFIGAWGEWHTSTNGLLEPYNYERITNALLDEAPTSRMIQIRYPRYARAMFPDGFDALGYAFDGSDAARVGLLNDCFLTTSSDTGTYESDADRVHAASVSRYTVMGGETCDRGGLNDRNSSANAIAEMAEYHWDYLNIEFWRPIIDRWRSEGSFDEISARLGYRYQLTEASAPATATAGETLSMGLTISNVGFGKLYNPRPLEIVLVPRSGGTAVPVRVLSDARSHLPLSSETTNLELAVDLPPGLAPGTYDLHLFLPDAADALRGVPAYAIRLANAGTWEADSGLNGLGLSVDVAGM